VLRAIYEMGYQSPSRIQGFAIPNIIKSEPSYRNFIGQAQSGTGKTLAFVVSMIERCNPSEHCVQALCISPTRELAIQTHETVVSLSKHVEGLTCQLLVPQVNFPQKIDQHMVIGTPGVINKCLQRRSLDLKNLKIFVLDEADLLLSQQGFLQEISNMKKAMTLENVQICLFSATYAERVSSFVNDLIPDPKVKVELKPEELSLDKMVQGWIDCKTRDNKFNVLQLIYDKIDVGQCIIFVQTVSFAKSLYERLTATGKNVSLLYGKGMDTATRDKIMKEFRDGNSRVLISTNVLSRGIDVLQVSVVINYDLPVTKKDDNFIPDPETYIHRVGRTARAGRSGIAISLVHDQPTYNQLRFIQNHLQKEISQIEEKDIEELGKMLREYDI